MSGHRLAALAYCISLGAAYDCPRCGVRVTPVKVTPSGVHGRVEWKGRLHPTMKAIWHDDTRCEARQR